MGKNIVLACPGFSIIYNVLVFNTVYQTESGATLWGLVVCI